VHRLVWPVGAPWPRSPRDLSAPRVHAIIVMWAFPQEGKGLGQGERFMIEPPPWKREPEPAGNRRGARQRAALWGGRGATGIRAWPGERLAGQVVAIWRRCRSLASQVQLAFNRWLGAKEASSPINRYALHLVVILMAFGVVTVSRIKLPEINVLLPAPTPASNRNLRPARR